MTSEEKFLAEFESDLSDPLSYLQPTDQLRARCLLGLKTVFDFYKRRAQSLDLEVPTGPLSELYTDGFDNEQIWAEIELMNEPVLKSLKKHARKVSTLKSVSVTSTATANDTETMLTSREEDDGGDGSYFDSEDELASGRKGEEVVEKTERGEAKRSIVDDRFFKLAEMERFLELSEKQEERDAGGDSETDDDDMDIDYFVGDLSDNDSDSGSVGQPHYDDFFDAPDQSYPDREVTSENSDMDSVAGDDDEACDSGDDAGDGEASDSGDGVPGDVGEASDHDLDALKEDREQHPPSTHEKKQLKMKQKITELEAVNVAPKSWQLGGESTGKGRPLNSLLAEDLSFDHMTRPAPVVTEETTKTLEDIIKQRILDEAWDDVERKIKPTEKPYDYSRSRPLEQEKSKLSLAEVYEQEYLKQTQTEEEHKEDERHTEIKELMKKLFVKLDALSNFHFTPKPPKPDVKIVANVPAIQMEEVAPVATSDAMRLAPEELQAKSNRPEVGSTEKTDTDRKHDRRLKKRRKRLQIAEKKQREKVLAKLRPGLGNKFTRRSLEKRLKEREHDELVDKSLRSSSRFFAKLQEEVKQQVKSVKKGEESGKKRTIAQQFKL